MFNNKEIYKILDIMYKSGYKKGIWFTQKFNKEEIRNAVAEYKKNEKISSEEFYNIFTKETSIGFGTEEKRFFIVFENLKEICLKDLFISY